MQICFLESCTVTRGLGVQLSTTRASGRTSTVFVERAALQDMVINEAIHYYTVVPYLALLVKGKSDLVVVFEVSHLLFLLCLTMQAFFASLAYFNGHTQQSQTTFVLNQMHSVHRC